VSGKQGANKGALGGEGEKEHALMKNQIKAIESKLKTMIEKERAKQEARSVDFEETRYFRSEARISLIGYTNVGKSAMMNALAGKHQVQSKDRLFETLKTTAREFNVSRNLKAVVVDTIGFIDNLPTELSKHPRLRVVDSFGGTLREIKLSDIILLMEDVSHPLMKRQREVAFEIIKALNLEDVLKGNRIVTTLSSRSESGTKSIAWTNPIWRRCCPKKRTPPQ
jgi:GTP-binding protein HflX